MPMCRYIILLTLFAVVFALLIPPQDLPETPYNEADTPFTAVLTASVHISAPATRQPVMISHHPGLVPLMLDGELSALAENPDSRPVSLPTILHVLLC